MEREKEGEVLDNKITLLGNDKIPQIMIHHKIF
jgi:hypothetical protein